VNRLNFPKEIGAEVRDFTIPRKDAGRYIKFDGELVAFATSDPHETRDRWTELRIFRSSSGAYIGTSIGCTCLPGESDLIDSDYSATVDGLIPFFTVDGKRSNLSLSLFEQVISDLDLGVEHV
jgi:hypothetical protein